MGANINYFFIMFGHCVTMGKDVKADFNEVCDNNVRRNYGGLNFLNLSCLPSSPDKSTYHFGMEFLKILPSLVNDMKTPSEDLQKYYSEATSKTASFMEHARAVTKDAKADPVKREAAANVVEHPLMGMAFTVDDFVNKSIKYKLDSEAFGKLDVWRRPSDTQKAREGDCEDYALLKMAMLRNMGFPNDKVWLMVGRQNMPGLNLDPGGHAVLMVEIDKQHYVLNNSKEGGPIPLKEFMREGRSFVPLMLMNGHEAFVIEDPSIRDVATQKSSIMMHAFKSVFSMDTVKADWERLTDAPQRKMPQFDF